MSDLDILHVLCRPNFVVPDGFVGKRNLGESHGGCQKNGESLITQAKHTDSMVSDLIVARYVATSPQRVNETAEGKNCTRTTCLPANRVGLAQNLHSVLVLQSLHPSCQAGGLSIAAQRLEDSAPLRSHGSQRACLAVGRSSAWQLPTSRSRSTVRCKKFEAYLQG